MPSYKSNEYVSDSEGSDYEYEAPKGFVSVTEKVKKHTFDIPSEKEVWIIKTPKGFPIQKLKTLPVSFTATSIRNGPEPFALEGSKFQINEETFSESNKLTVLGTEKDGHFHSKLIPVTRFYNIRETVGIDDIAWDSVKTPRVDVEKVTGLRMRHFPSGYGAGDYDEAQPERPLKRAKTDNDKEVDTKKSKKDKKEKSEKKDRKEKKEKKEKKKKT